MSRRDTILVAVLINTGLLALLFMIAINPEEEQILDHLDSKKQIVAVEKKIEIPEKSTPVTFAKSAVADELDQALQEYAEKLTPAVKNEPAATKEEPEYIEVTVKRGDFLERIAKGNGTSVSRLKQINHLSSEHLDIGQVLRVPLTQKNQNKEMEIKKKLEVEEEPKYYTIKEGDNPWKIAKNFNVRFDELLLLNNLNEDKARKLRAGDKVRVN